MIRKLRDFCASSSQIGSQLHSPRGAISRGSRSSMSLHYFDNEGMKSFHKEGTLWTRLYGHRTQTAD